MRWRGGRESENVEDRRGGGFGPRLPGGFGRIPGGRPGVRMGRAGGLGIGGIVVVLVLSFVFGIDPAVFLGGGGGGAGYGSGTGYETGQETGRGGGLDAPPVQDHAGAGSTTGAPDGQPDELKAFVSVVLADTEDVWNGLFAQAGRDYREPALVLFSGAVQSACGAAQSAMGPFYCPLDQKVYIDLSFYRELRDRFQAPGDFAQAYVIAHEVGHHVQTLLGISDRVRQAQQGVSRGEANELSVRLELQADCLSGIWAHHSERQRRTLEPGDIEEALNAASAIGDDRLQQQGRGRVVPESFTHGTSQQRQRWFARGFEVGDVQACDTFAVAQP
ncbi:MAG TPA: neutral zinc metallopeptidase [Azospirillaceae bacterium]|nr:neutral zinc metallopeptidase [Azospirillaceae bacterium]